MKSIKLNNLSKQEELKNNELKEVLGGQQSNSSWFCSSGGRCGCGGTHGRVKRNSRRSNRRHDRYCGFNASDASTE